MSFWQIVGAITTSGVFVAIISLVYQVIKDALKNKSKKRAVAIFYAWQAQQQINDPYPAKLIDSIKKKDLHIVYDLIRDGMFDKEFIDFIRNTDVVKKNLEKNFPLGGK